MKGEDKRLEAFLTSPPVQSGVISIRVYRGIGTAKKIIDGSF